MRFSSSRIVVGALFSVVVFAGACFAQKGVALDSRIPLIQAEIAGYDGSHGWYTTNYRKVESLYWKNVPGWMEEDAAGRGAASILDIGCGYGTLLAVASQIYGAEGYCLDVIPYMNPEFTKAHRLTFAQGNIETAPIPWGRQFDVIILTEVLEHFNFQPLPTMRKIHGALAPNGVLFLSTPDERDWGREYTYYRKLSELPMPDPKVPTRDAHIWIYSKKELLDLLTSAGFAIERLGHSPGNGNRHFNIKAVKK